MSEYRDITDEITEEDVRPLLTDEFLKTLFLAIQAVGYGVDYVETCSFGRECFAIAGKEYPEDADLPKILRGEYAI